jgi:hypothetical protein
MCIAAVVLLPFAAVGFAALGFILYSHLERSPLPGQGDWPYPFR